MPLLQELGHDLNRDLAFEVHITWQAGTTQHDGYADIVVFFDDMPLIVVETKKPGASLEAARKQVETYARAFTPAVPFIMAHDKARLRLYRRSADPARFGGYVLVDDLPNRSELLTLIGIIDPSTAQQSEREEAIERVVASEHYKHLIGEAVRVVLREENIGKVKGVAELAKVLLTKAYHEGHATGQFRPGVSKQRLFDEAKREYPGLYFRGEGIDLSRRTFDSLVKLLAQVEA